MENNRLVYYSKSADAKFWDAHWKKARSSEWYMDAEQGILPRLDRVTHHLPSRGKIIEAGCGLGQIVLALRKRGYDAEGVEWGEGTINLVKNLCPELPIRQGDVSKLDVPDGSYAGYISLGVMEHREDGPEAFLIEAQRVLKPDGIALISVPYIHPLRQCKAKLGLYRGKPDGLDFFQYAFTKDEFRGFLFEAGFEVIEEMPYGSIKGISDEIPPLRWIFESKQGDAILRKSLRFGRRMLQSNTHDRIGTGSSDNYIKRKDSIRSSLKISIWRKLERAIFKGLHVFWMIVERYIGHMILFVCKKTQMDIE
jgi:SAM-dependent methyltransferase